MRRALLAASYFYLVTLQSYAVFYLPPVVIHDRLGITDAMLNAYVPPILLASLDYARQPAPSRRAAALIGGLVGLACLVKLTGLFLLADLLRVVSSVP